MQLWSKEPGVVLIVDTELSFMILAIFVGMSAHQLKQAKRLHVPLLAPNRNPSA